MDDEHYKSGLFSCQRTIITFIYLLTTK